MIYKFETFELDTTTYELRKDGQVQNIEKQVFDLLWLVVAAPERIITKDEIIDTVWGGRIISDSAINSRISALRAAIGDSGREQRLIKTIHNQGLRFVGEVDVTEIEPVISVDADSNITPDITEDISPVNPADDIIADLAQAPANSQTSRKMGLIPPLLGGMVIGAGLLGMALFARPQIIDTDSYSPWQQSLPTESYLARDAYLRGIQLREKSYSMALQFSADQFQIAIDNDPNFGPAYAALASVNAQIYANNPHANMLLKDTIDQTMAEAKALSPKSKEVRLAEGEIAALRHDYGQALMLADQVIELDAHYLPAYLLRSKALYETGRAQDATDTLGVAISMDPLSPDVLQTMAKVKLAIGDYDGSVEAANANVWWNPDNTKSHVAMAEIQYNKAQYENAFYYLERAKALNPLETKTGDSLMRLYTDLGMPTQRNTVARTNVQEALVQAMLGEKEDAWALLGNLDLEDTHINMHYLMRDYDYAVRRFNIYLANRSEGSIQPGQGLHYARMCHVYERAQTPMRERICGEVEEYYADKSPADFTLYEDILGGSAFHLMNDDTENALLWLNFLVQKGHTFMTLTSEPVFAKFESIPDYEPINRKMAATAKLHQSNILEKLSD